MKMTALEFIELVRKMREAQQEYWRQMALFRPNRHPFASNEIISKMIALENKIDSAEITDICNLETNQPLV